MTVVTENRQINGRRLKNSIILQMYYHDKTTAETKAMMKIVFLMPLTLLLFVSGTALTAQPIKFQRIRTFDPVHGLPPEEPADAAAAPTTPNAPANANVAPTTPNMQNTQPNTLNQPLNQPLNQQGISPSPVTSGQSFLPAVTAPATGMTEPPAPSSAPASAAVSIPNTMAPLAPPDVPARPAEPSIDTSAVLPTVPNVNVKMPLAWRTRACSLAAETDEPSFPGQHPSCFMNGSVEDVLHALVQACQSRGLQILGESVSAGQLGARMNDGVSSKYLLIFVAKKISERRTLVKAAIDPDPHAQKAELLQDLLSRASSIVDSKGLL